MARRSTALLLITVGACARAPSVRYDVAVTGDSMLAITAVVDGVPGDSLTLAGFAPSRAMRTSDVTATDAAGRALRVRRSTFPPAPGDSGSDSPAFTLAGPLRGPVHVRWRVDPNVREGDAHMGYTGVRSGSLGPEFGCVTGRSVFLVPLPAERLREVNVRFELPRGWSAITPWRAAGDGWRTDIGGRYAAEHLVAATIGLGAFHTRSFRVGATEYDMDVATVVPDSIAASTFTVLEQTARGIHALFGRELGPRYRTLVVPEAAGDEIHIEGWATGQGGTLALLTALRLRDSARHLIEAYVRDAPYRIEVASPAEYWLVDAIANRFAWRAVAAAGLADLSEVQRELAVSYLRSRHVQGVEHDLERLYATSLSTQITREIEAPAVLEAIDHIMRTDSGDSLDSVVSSMWRSRPAASLWASLPGGEPRWREFRERHVRGAEPVRVAALFGVAPALARPDPPAGDPVRRLMLIVTGDTYGFLEHCGCKANQSGGVSRRATVIARLRHVAPDALLLDAGNAFLRDEKLGQLDFLSREEQKLYLLTMERERYGAMAIGPTELTFGAEWFDEARRGRTLPYVCANVARNGTSLVPAVRQLRSGDLRIAVVAALDPPRGPGASRRFEASAASLAIGDPVEALRRAVATVPDSGTLVIAMGRLPPATIRRAIAACPRLDVVISSDWDAPVTADSADAAAAPRDRPGFIGRTLVLYTDSENYGLESVDLALDLEGRVATARTTHHTLYEDVPDDPTTRAMLDRFYDHVGVLDAAQSSVQPLFAGTPARTTGEYVGAAACEACHRAEWSQWRTTAHAGAYKTLLDAHRHYQPRCVVCHVVGFATRTGFRLASDDERLTGVQCESCHGPAGEHARHPAPGSIARAVPEPVCLECHTPDHSERFVYADRLPRVVHRDSAVAVVRAR